MVVVTILSSNNSSKAVVVAVVFVVVVVLVVIIVVVIIVNSSGCISNITSSRNSTNYSSSSHSNGSISSRSDSSISSHSNSSISSRSNSSISRSSINLWLFVTPRVVSVVAKRCTFSSQDSLPQLQTLCVEFVLLFARVRRLVCWSVGWCAGLFYGARGMVSLWWRVRGTNTGWWIGGHM